MESWSDEELESDLKPKIELELGHGDLRGGGGGVGWLDGGRRRRRVRSEE